MTATEEAAAEGALTPGDVLGGAAGAGLCGVETPAVGAEVPHPAVSVASRRSATPVVPAAQFGRRDPDMLPLKASSV